MNIWRDKTLREKTGRNRRWGFWSKRGNDAASPPLKAFYSKRGVGHRERHTQSLGEGKPGAGCGKALQWKHHDRRVLCAQRRGRVDLTNEKMVPAGLNSTPLLLQTLKKTSRWKNLKSGGNMKKTKRRLRQEADNLLLLWDLSYGAGVSNTRQSQETRVFVLTLLGTVSPRTSLTFITHKVNFRENDLE